MSKESDDLVKVLGLKGDCTDLLETIYKGKIPEGYLMVKTELDSEEIELWDWRGFGFKMNVVDVETIVGDLERNFTESDAIYLYGESENKMHIPGYKVPKIAKYLREARDVGVKLGSYTQIF